MVSRKPPGSTIGSTPSDEHEDGQAEKFVNREGFDDDITDEQIVRIRESQKDVEIGYKFFEECLTRMSSVLLTGGKARPMGVILIGGNDSGKSTLLRAFRKNLEEEEHRVRNDEKDAHENSETPFEHYAVKPAFMFSIPSGATVRSVLERALNSNGIPTSGRMRLTQLENLLYERLRILKTRVILIDEFHDIARISFNQQEDILKAIKEMMNNIRIPIIAAGTRDAEPIIESDTQIYTRLEKIYILPFDADEHFRDFLLHYKNMRIHLEHGVNFEDTELVGYIHYRTNGLVGQVTQFLGLAVKRAILTGDERITIETLKKIPFTPM